MIDGNKSWSPVFLFDFEGFAVQHPVARATQAAAHERRSTLGSSRNGIASTHSRHGRPW